MNALGEVLMAALTVVLLGLTPVLLVISLRSKLPLTSVLILTPIIWGAVWAVVIEALSSASAVNQVALTIAAIAMAATLLVITFRVQGGLILLRDDAKRILRIARLNFARRTWWRWPVLASIFFVVMTITASLLVAVIGAPNNSDSLGYHLPRVMWWLQFESVEPYASPVVQQVTFPALNEYLLLPVMGISGTDFAANLVQWTAGMAAITAIVITALLATQRKLVAVVAFIMAGSIPTLIVQTTTTQSDLVAALWPVLALGLVALRHRDRVRFWIYIASFGAVSALAMATKPTGGLIVGLILLFGLALEFRRARSQGNRASVGAGLVLVVASASGAVLGALPQVVRNFTTTGSAAGVETDILVVEPTLRVLWANTVRTLANNVGAPPPLSDPLNSLLPQALERVGVPVVDPDAIYLGNVLTFGLGRNEDLTTNPIHLFLAFFIALIVICLPRVPGMIRGISIVGVLGLALGAGIFQWQEWSTRFFLAVILIVVIPFAWAIVQWMESGGYRANARSVLAVAILLVSATYGFAISMAQEYRPLVGPGSILTVPRSDQYFRVAARPGAVDTPKSIMQERIAELAQLPKGSRIGLYNLYAQEYTVWRLLNPDGRYTFVNLLGLDGAPRGGLVAVDGSICERDCP